VRYRLAAVVPAGVALAAVVACKSTPTRPAGDLAGAATARGAVERFLASVRAQDLQAMGLIWGSKNGPARETIAREELEKREVIMTQCLVHDSASFLDVQSAPDGDQQVRFVLYHGQLSRTTAFTAESGPQARWYVKEINLRDVHACTLEVGQPAR
jgi:hypothetical protein